MTRARAAKAETTTTELPSADELVGYVPEPRALPPTLDERLVRAYRSATRTPGRAATTVIAVASVVAIGLALQPVHVIARDTNGVYRARCGLAYFLGGVHQPGVDAACRSAYAGRANALIVAALVFLVAAAVLAFGPEGRSRRVRRVWSDLTSTPKRAALVALGACAVVAMAIALQPVTVRADDGAGELVGRCGVRFYVFGTDNAAIQSACRHAYAGRAVGFLLAFAISAGVVIALAWELVVGPLLANGRRAPVLESG